MEEPTATWQPQADRPSQPGEAPCLVLLGSVSHPERTGEIAFLDAQDPVLGRSGTLTWLQQRPGESRPTGQLDDPQLSRRQVGFVVARGTVTAQNLGRMPLAVNGRQVVSAELEDGDLLELGDRLLLLFTSRPTSLPGEPPPRRHGFGRPDALGWVGESPAAWELRRQVQFAAKRDAHVLVVGESGSGKELVAGALHALSSRRERAVVSRNAATIPESLADAELFGNVAGYPNPGMAARRGLVGEADGSTLFLDEFGELPPEQQAKLLRVLDSGEYTRLGEAAPRRADLRLIAATNRDPASLKHDVLARFALRVDVPSLVARPEDVPALAHHVLRRIAAGDPELARRFFPDADPTGWARVSLRLLRALVAHPYTTHVRELEALLWQRIAAATGDTLELPPDASLPVAAPRPAAEGSNPPDGPVPPRMLDPEVVQASLDRHRGHLESVWRELGLSSRHALARLIKKYDLVVPRR